MQSTRFRLYTSRSLLKKKKKKNIGRVERILPSACSSPLLQEVSLWHSQGKPASTLPNAIIVILFVWLKTGYQIAKYISLILHIFFFLLW